MFKIVCAMSKKGNDYIALKCNDVFVTFDEVTILKVAMMFGFSNLDVYALKVGEHIELK